MPDEQRSRLRQHAFQLAVVAVVLAVGLLVFQGLTGAEFQQRMQRETAEARAYCNQVFGDDNYVLINAMAVGHGGLHCESDSGAMVHLHDITEAAEEAALAAEVRGESVDWSRVQRYEVWHQRGFWPLIKSFAVGLALAVLVAVALKYAPGMAGGRR